MLKSRLALWKNQGKHSSYPENILVYRDGVSEGQYQAVLTEELPKLRQACKEIYPADQTKDGLPRMTVVIVGKRHHTRFFPTSVGDADEGTSNCIPGTVVDRGVTEARNWDFFLQAHVAIKGTARPAHYYVVHDEIFHREKKSSAPAVILPGPPKPPENAQDTLEDITQSLCYIFGRATRAVSICTPAYYADIVCERSRRYLRDLFDPTDGSENSSTTGGDPDPPTDGAQNPAAGEDPEVVRNREWQRRITPHDRLKNSMFYI